MHEVLENLQMHWFDGSVGKDAATPDDLSSIAGAHTVEGEDQLPQLVLQPPHVCHDT